MRQTQGSALAQLSQVFAAQLLATQAQKNTRADTKKNFYPTPRVMTLTAVEPSLCTVVLGYGTVGTVPTVGTYRRYLEREIY